MDNFVVAAETTDNFDDLVVQVEGRDSDLYLTLRQEEEELLGVGLYLAQALNHLFIFKLTKIMFLLNFFFKPSTNQLSQGFKFQRLC